MIVIFATTTNRHKFQEIAGILDLPEIRLRGLEGIQDLPEVEETGLTFEENAGIKARAYFTPLQKPVFADDSGLEVPALDNEPGVYSARYAGPSATYYDNNLLLIEKIKALSVGQRQARFVCTICYKDAEEEQFFTGTTDGLILDHLRGQKGFGYDPLFYLPERGKTFAELTADEKNACSHRGRAIRKLRSFLIRKFNLQGTHS